MVTNSQITNKYSGILSGIMARLEQNRLGDLLVQSGVITPIQLREALALQKATCQQLGNVLLQQRLITSGTLHRTLAQQIGLRCVAALFGLFITFSGAGGIKSARANTIKDVPVQLSMVMNAHASNISPVNYYPPLFGSAERRSTNLGPFTKWSGMFDSFNSVMASSRGERVMEEWMATLVPLRELPLRTMLQKVNDLVNRQPYIEDIDNWNKSDYWANPVDFFERGGDCEDFAIAKYTALRLLGVPEERLRLAIVHDKVKDIPHAILIAYSDEGPMVLDNQTGKVKRADKVNRYKPIFSINRQAWWLHTANKPTIVATAAQ